MLETENIDDDYFTPASSTSLANIFGKPRKDVTDNESLRYTAPKPSQSQTSNSEEHKATQCIFACALLGYEWTNGAYISRGKIGFALLKILKTGFHNIILYDSNKVTLSNMKITTNFEVTVRENVYFSYLDNYNKYWCLYASEEEMKKIINLLKSFNAVIKCSSNNDKEPPELTKPESTSAINETTENFGNGSDTDSSVNRKTKISILSRMACMGQSVLPPRTISAEKSSDSSDTNETSDYKCIRPKPVKVVAKRSRCDKSVSDSQSLVEAHKIVINNSEFSLDNMPLFTYANGQIVPVANSNLVSSSSSSNGNDLNIFISEQRVNNSEQRININRMSDKMDEVLRKISHIENKDTFNGSSSFQIEIMQKLLTEYENKIKVYEEIINTKKLDENKHVARVIFEEKQNQTEENEADNYLKEKIKQLEQLCQDKDAKISNIKTEFKILNNKCEDDIIKEKKHSKQLLNEIQNLNQTIKKNNEKLNILKQCEDLPTKTENDDLGNKIKNIMNNTFHAISAEFENDDTYRGSTVKSVMATVIKRVTIESLSNI